MDAHSSTATKFCETSTVFECDNSKNKEFLRDFLQKWKVECRADPRANFRAIFLLHLSEVLRLPQNSEAKSDEVPHLSRKIILAMLQNATIRRKSAARRPDLSYSPCHAKMHLCRSSSKAPRLPSFLDVLQNTHVWPSAESIAPATKNDA